MPRRWSKSSRSRKRKAAVTEGRAGRLCLRLIDRRSPACQETVEAGAVGSAQQAARRRPHDTQGQSASTHQSAQRNDRHALRRAGLAALGVVYGDIGTSPLYAVKGSFAGNHPIPVTTANICGSLSLFFWALVIVVSVKYVTFIMRADNRGEGGIMASSRWPCTRCRTSGFASRKMDHDRRRVGAAVLRRRHGDAGHFRPLGRRGLEVSHAGAALFHHPDHHRRAVRPLLRAEERYRRSVPSSARSCWSGSACWRCSASTASSTIRRS